MAVDGDSMTMTATIPDINSESPAKRRRAMHAAVLKTYHGAVARVPDDSVLDSLALRTGSRSVVDLLALHASQGSLRYHEVMAHVRQDPSSIESLSRLSGGRVAPAMLVRLARVVALQNLDAGDRSDALEMMRWVYRQAGRRAFSPNHARLFENLAFERGDFQLAATLADELGISPLDALIMKADLANPY